MHARICSALLSTLLLACSSNTAGTPFDRPTNDESVPQQGDVADSAPIVADAGHDAARVDAAADSSGDAVAHEAGPLVDAGSDAKDAAPAAWDACELVPAGKTAPTRLGHVWGYYARHLTSRGNKLLFTYSWSTGTSAVAVANTATGVVADLASGSSGSYGLVDTNGKDVVVGDVDGIEVTDFGGRVPTLLDGKAISLAVYGDAIYHARWGYAADNSDAVIYATHTWSSYGTSSTAIATGPFGLGMAADATGLYVGAEYEPPADDPVLGIFWVDPDAKKDPVLLAEIDGIHGPRALTLANDDVVVLASKQVFSVPKKGGAVKSLATTGAWTKDEIAADGTYAYWIESGTIRRVALSGATAAETIFSGACNVATMAVNADAVWFLTSPSSAGPTTVWKLPKP